MKIYLLILFSVVIANLSQAESYAVSSPPPGFELYNPSASYVWRTSSDGLYQGWLDPSTQLWLYGQGQYVNPVSNYPIANPTQPRFSGESSGDYYHIPAGCPPGHWCEPVPGGEGNIWDATSGYERDANGNDMPIYSYRDGRLFISPPGDPTGKYGHYYDPSNPFDSDPIPGHFGPEG